MKLGKKPARAGAVQFAFTDYFDKSKLPKPPAVFGLQRIVHSWGMLGNDKYGDCVWAGAAHETMLWCKEAGAETSFTDADVLSDYSAVTGFVPARPDTDNGTDMQEAAEYRRKTGNLDRNGVRHKIDSYVSLKVANLDDLMVATYLLGAVGVGIQMPNTADVQFDNAEPWDVVPKAEIDGGHYIPVFGRNSRGNILLVTWGRLHAMTPAFFERYNDEMIAYLSIERLRKSVSPEGFNYAALASDLAALRK